MKSDANCVALRDVSASSAGAFVPAACGVASPPRNPFSAHRLRPGYLAYIFSDGTSAASLVAKLRACNWRGQIVGPHGTGKSTLIETLLPELRRAGCEIQHWVHRGGELVLLPLHLGEGTHFLPLPMGEGRGEGSRKLVIIDGFEQLRPLARIAWKLRCRWNHWGLLVTSHRSVGLPTLWETQAAPQIAQQVVAQLLPAGDRTISNHDVSAALKRGNLRDALFELYDVYAERVMTSSSEAPRRARRATFPEPEA